jgi:hypothetical protein
MVEMDGEWQQTQLPPLVGKVGEDTTPLQHSVVEAAVLS